MFWKNNGKMNYVNALYTSNYPEFAIVQNDTKIALRVAVA